MLYGNTTYGGVEIAGAQVYSVGVILSPSVITALSSTGAPSVSPGAIAISVSEISGLVSAKLSTVSPGAITLSLAQITALAAANDPTLTPGSIAVLPSVISGTSTQVSGVPQINLVFTPSGVSVTDSPVSSTLVAGNVTISVSEVSVIDSIPGSPQMNITMTPLGLSVPGGVAGDPVINLILKPSFVAVLDSASDPVVSPGQVSLSAATVSVAGSAQSAVLVIDPITFAVNALSATSRAVDSSMGVGVATILANVVGLLVEAIAPGSYHVRGVILAYNESAGSSTASGQSLEIASSPSEALTESYDEDGAITVSDESGSGAVASSSADSEDLE